MKLASRIAVLVASVLFAVIGIMLCAAPERAAHHFGLEATDGRGIASLRADLGGLFAGLAALCTSAALRKRRAGAVAAAVILGGIAARRLVGWVLDGRVTTGMIEFTIEVVVIAALIVYAKTLAGPLPEAQRARRRTATPRSVRGTLKIVLGSLAILLAASGAALFTPAVQQKIFDRAALRMSARSNVAPLADDALRVAIAGSSAPLPSRDRAKACVVVFAGGRFWVVDSGPESVENLVLWGIPLSEIHGVLLTHFHSDHIGDLGELQLQSWAGGRSIPLDVYGGPGVEDVVAGFNAAYRLDQGYRTEHHGEDVMPSSAWGMVAHTVTLDGERTPAKDRTALVYDDGALRITAIEVDHAPIEPAYAYRFDYKGRAVVVTGDLKYHPPLVESAAGADILVSEAISRSMTQSLETAAHSVSRERTAAIMHDVQDYHISPEEAASLANDASVRLLVYYHLLPAADDFLTRRLFAARVNKVRRKGWTIAEDGSLYTLPLGTTDVKVGRIQ